MQPIQVNITVQPRHIPMLVCSDYSDGSNGMYSVEIAQAVAKALGIEDFLFHPERIHELQRWLWEQDYALSGPLTLGSAD